MNTKRLIALLLVAILCMTPLTVSAAGNTVEPKQQLSGFAAEFADPTDLSYKPHMRWWIMPGSMVEEEVRREIRLFAEAGYSGMELIAMAGSVKIHSDGWNEMVGWILDEAVKCGVTIDFTLGEGWPIATYDITRENVYTDPRTEKKLGVDETTFEATAGAMTYTQTELQYPEPKTTSNGCGGTTTTYIVNPNEYHELLAVSAAKKNTDGTYDTDSVVVLTELVDENGALTWTAPSEGTWSIFHSYMQSTASMQSTGATSDYPVIDHMSAEATKIITDAFDRDFEYVTKDGQKLGDLYKAAGGTFFGDSFELSSVTLWTPNMLEEFEARRGYDLTPYLPTIFSASAYSTAINPLVYEFDEIGVKVRMDYGRTVSELIAENHLQIFEDWADASVGMDLRYQVHTSAGALILDETIGSAVVDIPETESFALGNNLDQYRMKSGVVHMRNTLYTSETAAVQNLDWRQSWTGTQDQAGANRDLGFIRYTNRLFAAGVNKLYLHGSCYDTAGASFPGMSLMAYAGYCNEFDEHTPLWEYTPEMVDFLTRTQMVLQQGHGDIDLAYYRQPTASTQGDLQAAPRAVNQAGYSYDYVTETVLSMENAVVGERHGAKVLAPEGPSYKALVLELRRSGEPYAMTVETAERILSFAKAGLPVAVVGEAPNMVAGMNGTEEELAAVMDELLELAIVVSSGEELAAALLENGIYPDANPDIPGDNMFYHRNDGEVDFYFAANDSITDTCMQTVTFTGEGRPYLLNPWDGTVEPIAEYTAVEGGVVVDVDLVPGEQMLLAVAPHGWCGTEILPAVTTDAQAAAYEGNNVVIHTAEAGTYTVELSDGFVRQVYVPAAEEAFSPQTWNLVVHQWLPVNPERPNQNPYDKQIVDSAVYTLSGNDLKPWYEIDEENLLHAAGVGEYTTTIHLEKGWAEGQGAILSFTDASDCMEVIVNGENVTVNQLNSTVDIGPKLVAGENTIVVKVSSTMGNYMYAKAGSGMTKEQNTFKFGILGESRITPYIRTTVYDPEAIVTVNLNGEAAAAIDAEELTYSVTAENVVGLATATLSFEVSGLADPVVVPAEGWYIITQSNENGVVHAVLGNNAGVTSEEAVAIASLTAKVEGVGTASVILNEATLSSYVGSGEAFNDVALGTAKVETAITYSVYDVNQDGTVNQLDITRAQRFYGHADDLADVNDDGEVNIDDLILILNNYSK